MTNTPYIAFALLVELCFFKINNRNVDIAYRSCKSYLNFSLVHKTLLKSALRRPQMHCKWLYTKKQYKNKLSFLGQWKWHVIGILIFKISDEWPCQRSEIVKDSNAWDFEMWPLAVLTGDPINEGFFFYKKVYGRVSSGQNNVAAITWWPYYRGGRKAGFHCNDNN